MTRAVVTLLSVPRGTWVSRSVTEPCMPICSLLILYPSFRRYGDLDGTDFVVLVDADAPRNWTDALAANDLVIERMDHSSAPVVGSATLWMKSYVFKLVRYSLVLFLDIDLVVTGSLRPLLQPDVLRCGARAPDGAACVPLPDVRETCVNRSEAAIAAVQTTGTPLLTAAFVARPSLETFGALNRTLMRSEPKRGGCWGGCTKALASTAGVGLRPLPLQLDWGIGCGLPAVVVYVYI